MNGRLEYIQCSAVQYERQTRQRCLEVEEEEEKEEDLDPEQGSRLGKEEFV